MRNLSVAVGIVLLYLSVSTSGTPLAQDNTHKLETFGAYAAALSCDAEPEDGYTQQISGLVDGDELVVTVSARFAGAVESLTWRGKEFINIFDHGRQISYAWQMDGHGECLNPTEPGSASDLFSLSSTSELLEVCRVDENILTTKTKPAFWLAPGETGFCDAGAKTAVNDTLVSNQIMDKTIEIGYGGIENVIAFTIDIDIPESYNALQLEIPTGYLTYEFTNYWIYNPQSGEIQKPESQELVEPWSFTYGTNIPPILATEDGAYAMGVYSPENITAYEILMYDVPNPDDRTNKWGIVLHEEPAPAGVYAYQSFAIVGTLEQVTEAMTKLFELKPTDFSPPEGYVDLATCDVIEGWAWDPKTPNRPIELEFRVVNEDGSETTLASSTADRSRDDLITVLGDNGKHGYSVLTSDILQNGNRQTIRVYGLNSDPNLPARALFPSEHVLECPQFSPPIAPELTESVLATSTAEVVSPGSTTKTEGNDGESNLPCAGGALPLIAGLTFWAGKRRKHAARESS